MSIARQVQARRPYEHSNPKTSPIYHEGMHEDDVPVCSRCGRGPGNGISFLRDGYVFGGECDRCAQRLTSPRDTATRAARRAVIDQYDTRPECPAMDEPDRPEPDQQPARKGWRGLWAVRELRANATNCITLERAPRHPDGWLAKGWLARITLSPPGGQYEFERQFVKAGSKQMAGRSELHEYELTSLDDGIYEGETVGRDGQMKRLYLLVEDHQVQLVYRGKHDAKIALGRQQQG